MIAFIFVKKNKDSKFKYDRQLRDIFEVNEQKMNI